jgi:putative protease
MTSEQIEYKMRKSAGTHFVARRVEIDYPGVLCAPPRALNRLRRDLLAGLEKALLERRRPPSDRIREAKDRLQKLELPARRAGEEWSRPKLSVYADRLDILKGAVKGGSRRIYFEPLMEKGRGYKDRKETILAQLLEAKELCGKAELIWKWPRITRDDFIDLALPLLSEVQVNGIMVENVGPAWAIKEKMPEMPIYGGSGLNVWNHLTAQALAPQFCWLTLSPELSRRQLKDAVSAIRALPESDAPPNLELVVQGSLEVMVAEDSIPQLAKGSYSDELWGLQDFKHIFPLWVDDEGRTHIFNSAETCLIDLLPEICRIGLEGVSLDARGRTESYAQEVTGAYNLAIELTERLMATDPAPLKEGLLDLKERILPLALGGITHGHFLRGLKD